MVAPAWVWVFGISLHPVKRAVTIVELLECEGVLRPLLREKHRDTLGAASLNFRSASRTAEHASNGVKHPGTVNQELLKDRSGSTPV